ncbi:MAG TPA: ElyC/SanA/YdcF family protein, partial [Candidatus Omnitrophota bacterium]|nr:ElyC/SanA/YdcF family protein [Candidatus Omnitrophota bacterium]
RELFREVLKQFANVIENKTMKIDLSPQIVQPMFVILEGISKYEKINGQMREYTVESIENALQATQTALGGNYLDALKGLKDIKDKISVPVVDENGNIMPGTGEAGKYYQEIIRLFIAGMKHVGEDVNKFANLIGIGSVDNTYWWTYRSPMDKANSDFEMLADIADEKVIIGDDGNIKHGVTADDSDKVKAEDHRRLRQIANPVENVVINGKKYDFSIEQVKAGVEVAGVFIKGSVVRNCELLPGSNIVNSIVVGVQGRVRANTSEILDSSAPAIDAEASSIVNVIKMSPIVAQSRTLGGIYRHEGIRDPRTGFDNGVTIFDAAINFDGKGTDAEVVEENVASAKHLRDDLSCDTEKSESIRRAARAEVAKKINSAAWQVENALEVNPYVFGITESLKELAKKFPSDFVRITISHDLGRGDIRDYDFMVPGRNLMAGLSENAKDKLKDYLVSLVFNGLVTVGARDLSIYYDKTSKENDEDMVSRLSSVLAVFDNNPGSYGRILETLKRINGGNQVVMAVKSRNEYSLAKKLQKIQFKMLDKVVEGRAPQDISRVFPSVKRGEGTYLGIDVGGSDIKAVMMKDGNILYAKKFAWMADGKETQPGLLVKGQSFVDVMEVILNTMRLKYELDNMPKVQGRMADLKAKVEDLFSKPKEVAPAQQVFEIFEMAKALGVIGAYNAPLTAVGVSWPDIVAEDKIVGGDTSKTKGLEPGEFEGVITNLSDRISDKSNVPVFIINDGNIGSFYMAVREGRGNVLTFASGTSFGPGYVDATGRTTYMPLHMSNVICDLTSLELSKHKVTGINGSLQFYLAQDYPVYLATNGPLDMRIDMEEYFNRNRSDRKLKEPDTQRHKLELLQHILKNSTNASEIEKVTRIFTEVGTVYGVSTGEIMRFFSDRGIKEVPVMGQIFEGRSGDIVVSEANKIIAQKFPGLRLVKLETIAEEEAEADGEVTEQESLEVNLENTFGQAKGAAYFAGYKMLSGVKVIDEESYRSAFATVVDYLSCGEQSREKNKTADVLLVLGSDDVNVAKGAARLFKEGRFKYVLVSGKGRGETSEALNFKKIMIAAGVPADVFLPLEEESMFMGQNFEFSKKLLDRLMGQGSIRPLNSIAIVQKPLDMRLAEAYFYRVFGRDTVILPKLYAPYKPDTTDVATLLPEVRKSLETLSSRQIEGRIDSLGER